MERRTGILIALLVGVILGLSGLLIWQAIERAKWEKAFSDLNGVILQRFIMENPEVIIASVRAWMVENPEPPHQGFAVPRPPKELEAAFRPEL